MGEAKATDSKWKVITYIELEKFEQNINNLKLYESKLEIFFGKYNHYLHYNAKNFQQYKNVLTQIQYKFDHISELIANKREKRGLFNFLGSAIKYITGIPDSDDAQYYNEAIKQHENENKKLELLMKEQIQIVSNTISNFNESISSIQRFSNQINNNFVKLNNLTTQLSLLTMETEVSSTLQEIISKLNLDILITLEQVDTLLNSILFAKQNILHPQVLKPSKLIANLKEIVHSLPTEREFPIPLTASNGHTLLEMSTLQVYYSESKLIFIIIIPLTEILTFDIFHLYPLPIPIDENQY